MSNRFRPRFCYSLFVFAVGLNTSALADEGMWLFNAPPLKQLKEKYQFGPTSQWLEHLQKASVRFNSGGSGSFVSANGLVITNHHVGADTLQKIGDAQHNYLRDGFYAKTHADEIKSTDLELNVLVSIEDVTARVNGAVKAAMTSDQAASARNAAYAGWLADAAGAGRYGRALSPWPPGRVRPAGSPGVGLEAPSARARERSARASWRRPTNSGRQRRYSGWPPRAGNRLGA